MIARKVTVFYYYISLITSICWDLQIETVLGRKYAELVLFCKGAMIPGRLSTTDFVTVFCGLSALTLWLTAMQ